ncbi:MAG TPA: hypothetical protein VN372_08620 [Methanospirillum sp.]|nr:hypothetical protein [Methanospirillum sp.]
MKPGDTFLILFVILIMVGILFLAGCVEVTPPSGNTEASAYGPVGGTGSMTKGDGKQTSPDGTTAPEQANPSSGNQSPGKNSNQSSSESPQVDLPGVPNTGVIEVAPRSNPQSSSDSSSYSSPKPLVTQDLGQAYVTIYEFNKTFTNDAVAYAYDLQNPPLYIDLKFDPQMGTDLISHQKRTGDKEGMVDISVTRPLKDAWFEMRVYNQADGSDVLSEGFGKLYSAGNKSVVLRTAGRYQFDFMGDFIFANITMKVPMSIEAMKQYREIQDMLDQKKVDSEKIPATYLELSDLGGGWEYSGDITHSDTQYESVFSIPSSGYKLKQTITRFASSDEAKARFNTLKSEAASEHPVPAIVGEEGFQYESVRKTSIVFVQGIYLTELTSFSVPSVAISDLQRYAGIIVSRIKSA